MRLSNMRKINQYDANFMAGVEVGVRCHEKGMNLQMSLEYAAKIIKDYPQRDYKPDGDTETGKAIGKLRWRDVERVSKQL